MADLVVSAVERVAKTWRKEAEERRRISKADPIADTLDYCAGEIAARLRALVADEHETAEQRAAREGVTVQTVRHWIRTGQLVAQETPHGYKIPKQAQRVRRSA